MAQKLEWILQAKGGQQVQNEIKAIGAAAQSVTGKVKGIQFSDFAKSASPDFIAKNKELFDLFGQQSGKAMQTGFAKTLRAPPIIAQFQQQQRASLFKNLAAGIIGAPFNPYVSARGFAGAFGGGTGGASGGGGGGVAGNALAIAAGFAAVKVATEALHFAFNRLKDAIERGADLFLRSASTGMKPGQLAGPSILGRLMGISPEEIDRMSMQYRFAGAGGRTVGGFRGMSQTGVRLSRNRDQTTLDGLTLAAQSMGSEQTILRIRNLRDMTQQYMEKVRELADVQAASAQSLLDLKMKFTISMESITTEFMKLGAVLDVLSKIKLPAAAINLFTSFVSKLSLPLFALGLGKKGTDVTFDLMRRLGLIKEGGDNFAGGAGALGSGRLPANQFQRMGFVMHGGPNEVVDLLGKMQKDISRVAAILYRFFSTGVLTPFGNNGP